MAKKKLPAKMKKYAYNNVTPPKKGMQYGGAVRGKQRNHLALCPAGAL